MDGVAGGSIHLTRFYVSDHVFDEAMIFIECVLRNHDLALKGGDALLSSPFTTMLRVDDEVFDEAWGRFKSERGLSFTDCSSFVLMERYGVSHAFTFDWHFEGAEFQTLP